MSRTAPFILGLSPVLLLAVFWVGLRTESAYGQTQ